MKKAILLLTTVLVAPVFTGVSLVHADEQQPASVTQMTQGSEVIHVETSTVQEVIDKSSLTPLEKVSLSESMMQQAKKLLSSDMYKARYYRSSEVFSKAKVKKMAKEGKTVSKFTALLPSKLKLAARVIYGSYYARFKTAAKHGWGVKVTLTIDSYTQTTAGMSYSFSYIK